MSCFLGPTVAQQPRPQSSSLGLLAFLFSRVGLPPGLLPLVSHLARMLPCWVCTRMASRPFPSFCFAWLARHQRPGLRPFCFLRGPIFWPLSFSAWAPRPKVASISAPALLREDVPCYVCSFSQHAAASFFLPTWGACQVGVSFGFMSWQHGLLTLSSPSTSTPCPANVFP